MVSFLWMRFGTSPNHGTSTTAPKSQEDGMGQWRPGYYHLPNWRRWRVWPFGCWGWQLQPLERHLGRPFLEILFGQWWKITDVSKCAQELVLLDLNSSLNDSLAVRLQVIRSEYVGYLSIWRRECYRRGSVLYYQLIGCFYDGCLQSTRSGHYCRQ